MHISFKKAVAISSIVVLSLILTPFGAVGILCTMYCVHHFCKSEKVDLALTILLLILVNIPGVVLAFLIYYFGNILLDEKVKTTNIANW